MSSNSKKPRFYAGKAAKSDLRKQFASHHQTGNDTSQFKGSNGSIMICQDGKKMRNGLEFMYKSNNRSLGR